MLLIEFVILGSSDFPKPCKDMILLNTRMI
jgi:hypothetical protein